MDTTNENRTTAFRRRLRALSSGNSEGPLEPIFDGWEGQAAFRQRLRDLKGRPLAGLKSPCERVED